MLAEGNKLKSCSSFMQNNNFKLLKLLNGKKLILASGSPRRKELLAGLDVDFTVETDTTFNEIYDPSTPSEEVPMEMAKGKSLGFHRDLSDDEILLTSDTMVICEDRIMGKPKDRQDAVNMLKLLSGREHKVITAIYIRSNEKSTSFSETAKVFFNELTEEEISYYIDTYKPFDKAGAYGIQEWIGHIAIQRIEGSYFNIMGFPVAALYQNLLKFLD